MNALRERDRRITERIKRLRPDVIVLPRTRLRRYPIWSIKTVTIVSLLVTALIAAAVFWFGKRSLLIEAEWVAVLVASCLFVFLFVGLYRGVRVKKGEPAPSGFELIDAPVDAPDIGGCLGAVDDLPGLILAPVLFVVLGVVLVFLLPILVNVVWLLLFVFVVMLFWIFRAALRQVFVCSRVTRGKVAASLRFAAWYTFLYAGWLVCVLAAARAFSA